MSKVLYGHVVPALLALIAVMVLITSGEQIRKWWGIYTPAIKWQGAKVITPKVKPGEVLTIEYTALINKQCPSDLRGVIFAPDGSAPIRFPVTKGGYTKPSDEVAKVRVSILIPTNSDPGLAPLASGRHIYRSFATRYCPDGVEEDAAIPDAVFQLEVP